MGCPQGGQPSANRLIVPRTIPIAKNNVETTIIIVGEKVARHDGYSSLVLATMADTVRIIVRRLGKPTATMRNSQSHKSRTHKYSSVSHIRQNLAVHIRSGLPSRHK
jgi:hypothetical protein